MLSKKIRSRISTLSIGKEDLPCSQRTNWIETDKLVGYILHRSSWGMSGEEHVGNMHNSGVREDIRVGQDACEGKCSSWGLLVFEEELQGCLYDAY